MDQIRVLLSENTNPLLINRPLARALGLRNSIILQQVFYWMELNRKAKKDSHFIHGVWWCFNSYPDWQSENFDFWDVDTIKNGISELEEWGLIVGRAYNLKPFDRTKWYTIYWEAFDLYISLWREMGEPRASNARKNEAFKLFFQQYQMAWGKLSLTIEETFPEQRGNFPRPIPEIISETQTKIDSVWFRMVSKGKVMTFPKLESPPLYSSPILTEGHTQKYISTDGDVYMTLGPNAALAYLYLGYQYGSRVSWSRVNKILNHADLKALAPITPTELYQCRGWLWREKNIKEIFDPEKIAHWLTLWRQEQISQINPQEADENCPICLGTGQMLIAEGDILEGIDPVYGDCTCLKRN